MIKFKTSYIIQIPRAKWATSACGLPILSALFTRSSLPHFLSFNPPCILLHRYPRCE